MSAPEGRRGRRDPTRRGCRLDPELPLWTRSRSPPASLGPPGILATARRQDPVRVARTSESLGQCRVLDSLVNITPLPTRISSWAARGAETQRQPRRSLPGLGRRIEERLGKRFRKRLERRLGKLPETLAGRGPSAGAARAPLTPSSSGPDPDQSGPGQRRGPDAGGRWAVSVLTGAQQCARGARGLEGRGRRSRVARVRASRAVASVAGGGHGSLRWSQQSWGPRAQRPPPPVPHAAATRSPHGACATVRIRYMAL